MHLLELINNNNEGHPVLWYLLLYIGRSIADTPVILPIISILIAFAAVAIFVFLSPFPLWFKGLFIFGALPFYEYSVVARNYGISMLLFFLCATLYPNRNKCPLLLAFVLALLANTNAHSAILVCLIAAMWAWDAVIEHKTVSVKVLGRSLYVPLVIVGVGVLLCVAVTMPGKNTIVTHVYSVGQRDLARSFIAAAVYPGGVFSQIVPGLPRPTSDLLLYIAVLGLIVRGNLFLAALSGQVALGMFFGVVYGGGYRHQGLFLIFLLTLYWIALESPHLGAATKMKRIMFNVGLYVSVLIMLFGSVLLAKSAALEDIRIERSSSRAFGQFLNGSRVYRDAILVPEPDYIAESLPYYAKNAIYLSRERRFGTTVSFTTDADYRLSLGELLFAARDIKTHSGKPVLIVLGHWDLVTRAAGEKRFSYNKVFSWSAEEIAELNRSAELVAQFNSASGDENYRVYALK